MAGDWDWAGTGLDWTGTVLDWTGLGWTGTGLGDWTGLTNGKEQTERKEGVCRGSGQWTSMQYTSLHQ